MQNKDRKTPRKRRHHSIRKRMSGTSERPRLVVFRSLNHIYAQVIDDAANKVLVSACDLTGGKSGKKATEAGKGADKPEGNKRDRAKKIGQAVAKKCLEQGIKKVVFDRAGYQYHGRVSQLAEGAREGGLQF